MENNVINPAPVNPEALLKRQLSDWETLRIELLEKSSKEPAHELFHQVAYCETKIIELNRELEAYTSDPSNR